MKNIITTIDGYNARNNILIILITGPPYSSEFMKQYNVKGYNENQFKVYIMGLTYSDYIDDASVYIYNIYLFIYLNSGKDFTL